MRSIQAMSTKKYIAHFADPKANPNPFVPLRIPLLEEEPSERRVKRSYTMPAEVDASVPVAQVERMAIDAGLARGLRFLRLEEVSS